MFRVRNLYLSVDPAQRGWVNNAENYSEPVPVGSVMRALAVGRVIESRHHDFAEGLLVYGWFGWQQYANVSPELVVTRIVDETLPASAYAGVLGINGLTAYLALEHMGGVQEGETVFVTTAAAGAVGSLIGQIAKARGARVFGATGSDEKVRLCHECLGCDGVMNYRTHILSDILEKLVPEGIDLFCDHVGGGQLDDTLRAMKKAGGSHK